jgi:hypothetical protein
MRKYEGIINMKFGLAVDLMRHGYKVARKNWKDWEPKYLYIQKIANEEIMQNGGKFYNINQKDVLNTDWYIYKEK